MGVKVSRAGLLSGRFRTFVADSFPISLSTYLLAEPTSLAGLSASCLFSLLPAGRNRCRGVLAVGGETRVRVQPVLLLLTQPVDVPRGSACWPGRLRPGIGSPQGGWRGASRGCACRVAVLRRWRRRSQGCLHLDLGEAQGRPGPPARVPNGPCPRVPKMALDRRPGIADVTPRRFRLLHQGVVEVRVVAVCAVGVVSPPHAPRRFQKQL